MTTRTITYGTDQNGQKYQFAHDGQKALIFTKGPRQVKKWQFLSRADIRSLVRYSAGMGIKWDEPDKIRDLYTLRVATKSDRQRKALEHDVKYAPYRIPAMMLSDD